MKATGRKTEQYTTSQIKKEQQVRGAAVPSIGVGAGWVGGDGGEDAAPSPVSEIV